MTNSPWKFWIDVGGTFTDLLAASPDGREQSLKILSSGIVKSAGRIRSSSQISTDHTEPDRFWAGANVMLAGANEPIHYNVTRFEHREGLFHLDRELPSVAECEIAIDTGMPAPCLAMHLATGTPLRSNLPPADVYLGSTRGTNALLTRTGAKTALITSTGFRDLLTIGDQTRPDLFELAVRKPEPLFCQSIEIEERVLNDGTVETRPDPKIIEVQLQQLKDRGIESIAVCLMHSWRFPEHEQIVGEVARRIGFDEVRLSSDVAPMIKIVPRGETTVLDAYLNPVLGSYLDQIAGSLSADSQLHLMTSAGRLANREDFSGKDSVLSGPAGGVVAAARVAEQVGYDAAIGFDMGGTSTDVSRYSGKFEIVHESKKAGINLLTPAMEIETVAAGGGSICRFDGTRLLVGPESAGADPGPACYGNGGPLTVTDLNLFLGRLATQHFPLRLDREKVVSRLGEIREAMLAEGLERSLEEIATGFLEIANNNMAAAIAKISVARGFHPADHLLVAFGGAAGQHCCRLAEQLAIGSVMVHPRCSIQSAFGIRLAEHALLSSRTILKPWSEAALEEITGWFEDESRRLRSKLFERFDRQEIEAYYSLELRYCGTDPAIAIERPEDGDYTRAFESAHLRLYGYTQDRELEVVAARVEVVLTGELPGNQRPKPEDACESEPIDVETFSAGRFRLARQISWSQLAVGAAVNGPATIIGYSTSVVVDKGWRVEVLQQGQLLLSRVETGGIESEPPISRKEDHDAVADPVQLEIFNGNFRSIAEQMGAALQRTSISINVKQRLDYSCAVFSADGDLVASAAHIPVHLGAMSETIRSTIRGNAGNIHPGDVFLTNDPYAGGSHLPDLTVVTPVFLPGDDRPSMWLANRSHHAEIGGIAPGSMPAGTTCLAEEGVLIRNMKLIDRGNERFEELRGLLQSAPYPSRNPKENLADVAAQVAANRTGANALERLVAEQSLPKVLAYMQYVRSAAAARSRIALGSLKDGSCSFADQMDDGTSIQVEVEKLGDQLVIDFAGTDSVHPGNLNANRSIVSAAVMYVLRCLIREDIPLNEGVLEPVEIRIPECFLNPQPGPDAKGSPAVVGGNVETSQRVVDVLLAALGLAAASQGTMNNWLIGDQSFGYYETIGGGSGATAHADGANAVHCHMSNTRMTDPEVLETRLPLVSRNFAVRNDSGGSGRHCGGDGMIREIEFRQPLVLSLLTSRRTVQPFGLEGGLNGAAGANQLIRANGESEMLPSQCERAVRPGDRLRILTPGGGGFGELEE